MKNVGVWRLTVMHTFSAGKSIDTFINSFDPGIIITHSGGAKIPGFDCIIMDGEQTLAVINSSPEAVVVAIHMEALDHCTIAREALRQMAEEKAIPPSRLRIPKDGETIVF